MKDIGNRKHNEAYYMLSMFSFMTYIPSQYSPFLLPNGRDLPPIWVWVGVTVTEWNEGLNHLP